MRLLGKTAPRPQRPFGPVPSGSRHPATRMAFPDSDLAGL
jgi:hypothetical protein